MKRMLKIFIFLMSMSFVISSCSSSSKEVFDMTFSSVSDGIADLGGMNVRYEIAYADTTYLGLDITSEFSDLARERVANVEKDYNCTVELVHGTGSFGTLVASTYAGTYLCDILCGDTNAGLNAARAGILVGITSLNGIIDIHDSHKWGNQGQLQAMCHETDVYGLLPASWPMLTESSFGYPLVVNENIVAQLAQPDPREYVENKTWTWEKFEECIENYTYIESGEVKIYGLSAHGNWFLEPFIRTNGNCNVYKNADGTYSYGLTSQDAVTVIAEAQKIWNGDISYAVFKGVDAGTSINKFMAREATMVVADAGNIFGVSENSFSRQIENFAVLSWPVGPDAEPDHYTSVSHGYHYSITLPILGKDPEATAMVLDAIYEPLPGYETFDIIKEHMSRYYFFDTRDCDNFYNMLNAQEYNFVICHLSSMYNQCLESKLSPSAYIESMEDSAEELFEEYVMPVVRGIEAVWGSYGD